MSPERVPALPFGTIGKETTSALLPFSSVLSAFTGLDFDTPHPIVRLGTAQFDTQLLAAASVSETSLCDVNGLTMFPAAGG